MATTDKHDGITPVTQDPTTPEVADAPQSHEQTFGHTEGPTAPATPPDGPHSPHDEATQLDPLPGHSGKHAEDDTASPVTELRTAAAKLRKHVKHATDSPWVTSTVWSPRATSTSAIYSHAHPTGTVESEVVASGKIRSGYGGIREPWNAEYIGLMQPDVGAELAKLLDLEADVIEARAMEDGTDEFAVDLGGDHALILARLINHGPKAVAS